MEIQETPHGLNISGTISALNIQYIFEKLNFISQNNVTNQNKTITIQENSHLSTPTLAMIKLHIEELNLNGANINLVILNKNAFKALDTNKFFNLKEQNKTKTNTLAIIGKASLDFINEVKSIYSFVKKIGREIILSLKNPKSFRYKETITQIDQSGFFAIGIVCLVTFLIGIVVAYLMGNQLQSYGANIFVVDGVAIAMCRELSPILVSIVVAGRSGSAFAAQLGSMKLNQEIDALEAIGLRPIQMLVIPRILGLMICLPLLVILGDISGILGGMLISNFHLDVSYANFIDRLNIVLKPRQILVGLIKAPIFALFIAAIGCKLGLESAPNAVSIGNNTTRTVVQSIVSVILINAAAAIIFTQFKI